MRSINKKNRLELLLLKVGLVLLFTFVCWDISRRNAIVTTNEVWANSSPPPRSHTSQVYEVPACLKRINTDETPEVFSEDFINWALATDSKNYCGSSYIEHK